MQMFLSRLFKFIFWLNILIIILMLVFDRLIICLFLAIPAIIFRKLSWFFSPESRRTRLHNKFEKRKKKFEETNLANRNKLSNKSGRKNIHELARITKNELNYRKKDAGCPSECGSAYGLDLDTP